MARVWALALAVVVLGAMIVTILLLRAPDDSNQPAGGGTVVVPPALPGEPSLGTDREVMLQKFAANISQGLYTRANLLFLLCNSEAGRAVADQSRDPLAKALMRRMVLLFRSAPGMAHATCPPPATP